MPCTAVRRKKKRCRSFFPVPAFIVADQRSLVLGPARLFVSADTLSAPHRAAPRRTAIENLSIIHAATVGDPSE